jgi:hypothetical protein
MALWVMVLVALVLVPLIFNNRPAAEKARLRSGLKTLIGLWVLVTLVQIGRVGYSTHWANVPALIVVACIPLTIIIGAFVWMSKNAIPPPGPRA